MTPDPGLKPKPRRKLNRKQVQDVLERNIKLYKDEDSFVPYLVDLAIYLIEYEYDWADSEAAPPVDRDPNSRTPRARIAPRAAQPAMQDGAVGAAANPVAENTAGANGGTGGTGGFGGYAGPRPSLAEALPDPFARPADSDEADGPARAAEDENTDSTNSRARGDAGADRSPGSAPVDRRAVTPDPGGSGHSFYAPASRSGSDMPVPKADPYRLISVGVGQSDPFAPRPSATPSGSFNSATARAQTGEFPTGGGHYAQGSGRSDTPSENRSPSGSPAPARPAWDPATPPAPAPAAASPQQAARSAVPNSGPGSGPASLGEPVKFPVPAKPSHSTPALNDPIKLPDSLRKPSRTPPPTGSSLRRTADAPALGPMPGGSASTFGAPPRPATPKPAERQAPPPSQRRFYQSGDLRKSGQPRPADDATSKRCPTCNSALGFGEMFCPTCRNLVPDS